jgi:hypothetical protein
VTSGVVKPTPTRQHVRVPQQTHLPDVWTQARALRDRGDLASARMLLEDSLDSATFQYGEDHPDILATALLLATLHRRAGDLPTARRVLEEALQAGSLRLDESEPVLLKISFELAGVADQLGNRHEARKHYSRVAAHGGAVEGMQDQLREALAWLGPQAAPQQPHSPAPGVLAVPPQPIPPQPGPAQPIPPQPGPANDGLPQRVPQSRPFMGGPGVMPPAAAGAPIAGSPPPAVKPVSPQQITPAAAGAQPAVASTGAALAEHAATPAVIVPVQHAPLPALSGPVRFSSATAPEPLVEQPAAPPPPPVAQPSQVFTSAPAVIVEKRGRGASLAAIGAALVAVVAAGVVIFVLFANRNVPGGPGGDPQTSPQQQVQRGPATNLAISDRGDSITLRWTDPAAGAAGFAVKMGPSRDSMKLVTGNLGGKPTFTITGLNARFAYCFSVVTIYSGSEFYDSAPVCTTRTSAKPS